MLDGCATKMTEFVIVATYCVEKRFRVPTGYTREQIKAMIDDNQMEVKWDTLYIDNEDEDEEALEIEAHWDDFVSGDFKRPQDLRLERADPDMDADEDEEEEEVSTHQCHTCSETMTHAQFENGKMCCDKPRFDNEETCE